MIEKYEEVSAIYISLSDLKKVYMKKDRNLGEYKRIGIDFGGNRINLFPIMYSMIIKGVGKKKTLVLLESYQERNVIIIDSIINFVLHQQQKGLSLNTSYTDVRGMIQFWDWIREEQEHLPWSIEEARTLYEKYTIYLKQRMRIVDKGSMTSSTAHYRQKTAKDLLQEIYDDREDVIPSFIPSIPKTSKKREVLVVDNEEVEYAFNFYYKFFDQVANFLLDGGNYPFKLDLPHESLWVFPHGRRWIHPSHRNQQTKILTFNYDTGSIMTEEEVISAGKSKNKTDNKQQKIKARRIFLDQIDRANKMKKSNEERLILGSKAIKAYFMVLLALTGGNDKQISMMPWNGEFDEDSNMYGFKTIKPRAKYKEVKFEIQSEFIGSFSKFLRLRDYVLQGHSFDYLFFNGYGQNVRVIPAQEKGYFGKFIYESLFSRIDPTLKRIMSRKFRVYKTKWVLNEYGVWVASLMSQSTMNTILKSYHGESPEDQFAQVQSFMEQMHYSIITKDDEVYVETSVGVCASIDVPLQEFNDTIIKSDCSRPEGCLFCKHYRLHPDKKDIRKLLSLEYILKEVLVLNAQNSEHYEKVMGPVLNRIEALEKLLREEGKDISFIVEEVKNDVYDNENLSHYWEQKLKSLYRLGVVR